MTTPWSLPTKLTKGNLRFGVVIPFTQPRLNCAIYSPGRSFNCGPKDSSLRLVCDLHALRDREQTRLGGHKANGSPPV